MAFNRPSLAEIAERIATDFESRLPGTDARLRRSNVGVLARVWAGAAHGMYGFLQFASRQAIPDTAEAENLERWAAVWGIVRNEPGKAAGIATFLGLNGVVIPAGTKLQRSDGIEFETTAQATIAGGFASIPVVATAVGSQANTSINTRMVLAAQIMGVNAQASAGSAITGGTDTESDESLRTRLLSRIQQPPQGGSPDDYQRWAREVPGVTRAWVFPAWMGIGTVGVFFVRDGDASMIPDVPEVAAVQSYIDARRPVTATVYCIAPTPLAVNFTLSVTPGTPEVKAAVAAELADLFVRESSPGGTMYLSHFREAVSLATGESNHVITTPVADVVAGAGQMPVLGSITWV